MNNSAIEFQPKKVYVMEWKSFFFPEVRYVGYIEDPYSNTGRRLMSLGRTPAEAETLSYNKQYGNKIWRIAQWIELHG